MIRMSVPFEPVHSPGVCPDAKYGIYRWDIRDLHRQVHSPHPTNNRVQQECEPLARRIALPTHQAGGLARDPPSFAVRTRKRPANCSDNRRELFTRRADRSGTRTHREPWHSKRAYGPARPPTGHRGASGTEARLTASAAPPCARSGRWRASLSRTQKARCGLCYFDRVSDRLPAPAPPEPHRCLPASRRSFETAARFPRPKFSVRHPGQSCRQFRH